MPKKPYIEQYIEKKAKKNEIVDYDDLNKAFKQCKYCKKSFHPSGLFKHEMYCKENPNHKSGYKEKRMWKYNYCESLFTLHKEFKLHKDRCSKNPNIITNDKMDRFDQLRFLQEKLPKIYNLLTSEQIKDFLDDHIKNNKKGGEQKKMTKITKKYLQERCNFKEKTVLKAFDFDGLWAIVKQLEEEDQHSIFRITDVVIKPLNDNQIDALCAYLPNEVKDSVTLFELTKREKLAMVRDNKEHIATVIERKGFTDRVDLNANELTQEELYSSEKLWDIVKTDKYNLV